MTALQICVGGANYSSNFFFGNLISSHTFGCGFCCFFFVCVFCFKCWLVGGRLLFSLSTFATEKLTSPGKRVRSLNHAGALRKIRDRCKFWPMVGQQRREPSTFISSLWSRFLRRCIIHAAHTINKAISG